MAARASLTHMHTDLDNWRIRVELAANTSPLFNSWMLVYIFTRTKGLKKLAERTQIVYQKLLGSGYE